MPLPRISPSTSSSHTSLSPTNLPANLEQAIDKAFEEKGLLSKKDRAAQALEANGLTVEDLAFHLANLIFSAKDHVKRNAILDAFGLHGINLKAEEAGNQAPNIIFQISGDNVNLNQLFAPPRDSNE